MSEHVLAQPQKTVSPANTSGHAGLLQRKCACGGTAGLTGRCAECDEERLKPQRRAANQSASSAVPPIVDEVLRSPGQSLDPGTRTLMESRFGRDFSRVRVHTSEQAAKSAEVINALAYTVGSNVVFGAGQYAPGASYGQRLLSHELTHVVQQARNDGGYGANVVSQPGDIAERQADRIAATVGELTPNGARSVAGGVSPMVTTLADDLRLPSASYGLIQREATRPRAATGSASIEDVKAQTATLPKGKVTAGSLARTEWESLFRRHFIEPDQIADEVESSHARYLYSRIYGWIDAQHFFAHIQFAEESGLEAATEKGIKLEVKQASVRKQVAPDKDLDPAGYTLLFEDPALVTPDDLLHYHEELIIAFGLAKDMVLSKQEQALVKGFSDEQIAKLLLDNALSAWSAEDLVSNQLGVQFFRLHGAYVNAATDPTEVRERFINKLAEFFTEIQIVNEPATVKSLGAKLPGKERWHSKKMTETEARKKYPELFEFNTGTHRLRVVIHDNQADAEKGKEHVGKVAPSVPGLHVESLGSQFAVYTGPVSHFEAMVMKMLLVKAIPITPKAVVIESVPTATAPKK